MLKSKLSDDDGAKQETRNDVSFLDDLVEETFTARRSTKAWNTIVTIPFPFELVVVRKFLVCEELAEIPQVSEDYEKYLSEYLSTRR